MIWLGVLDHFVTSGFKMLKIDYFVVCCVQLYFQYQYISW